MIRRLVIAASIIAAVLAPTGRAEAHTGPAHAVFKSSTSGWYQARVNHEPIWIANVPGSFPDSQVYSGWNAAAGWQMIRPTSTASGWIAFSGDLPEDSARVAWVEEFSVDNGDWYYKCIIHYKWSAIVSGVIDGNLFAHEVGHCLGYNDHLSVNIYNCTPDTLQCADAAHPQCNAPDQPYYSAYSGIMSYCNWYNHTNWYGTYDKASLYHWGYGLYPS